MDSQNNANSRLVLTPHAVKRHSRRLQQEIKQIIEQKDLNKFNLSQSQDMFARILGMTDWHEMHKVLSFDNVEPITHLQLTNNLNNNAYEIENFINNYDVYNINYIHFIESICSFEDIQSITIQTNDNIIVNYDNKNIALKVNKKNNKEIINTIEKIYGETAFSKLNMGYDLDVAWHVNIARNTKIRFRINITSIMCAGEEGYSITFWKLKDRAKELNKITNDRVLINAMSTSKGLVIVGGNAGSNKNDLINSFLQRQLKNEFSKIGFYQYSSDYIEQDENNNSFISYVQIGKNIKDIKSAILNATRRNLDILVFDELNDAENIKNLASVISKNNNVVYTTISSSNLESLIYRIFSGLDKNSESYCEIIEQLSLLVQQDIIKDINNNPLYLHTYLEFNEKVKSQVMDMINGIDFTFDYFRSGMKKIINEHMINAESGLKEALNNGRLNNELYNHYKKIFRI